MGLGERDQNLLYQAGILHDIGKILTPESILLKPDSLTPQEYSIMKKHAALGESIIATVGSLSPLLPTIRHHHERYDGKGYPDGLQGEQIPFHARILAIADAFDAMTTDRAYRPRKTHKEAVTEVWLLKEKQFDPYIADIACTVLDSCAIAAPPVHTPFFSNPEDLNRLAYFYKDSLTGLLNDTFFDLCLKHRNDNNFKYCYYIEINHMHSYNRRWGWKAGDLILMIASQRLKQAFPDLYIFRIHGDAFAILSHEFFPLNQNVFCNMFLMDIDMLECSLYYFNLTYCDFNTHADIEISLNQLKSEAH
jgi:GGDEF domain-containing protein